MQLQTLLLTLLATTLPTALAGNALIKNNCPFPIYLNSNLNNQVKTIPSKGSYTEPISRAGSAIKLGTTTGNVGSSPLTMEYTPSNGLTYYDLSNNAGNPFSGYRNTLVPGLASCTKVDCAANAQNCYSNGKSIKVFACQTSSDLTTTLCA